MEIVYAAHTESGVFMLDAEGVCRWAVALPGRTQEKVPERIVGAQYVATLDVATTGCLVDLPRVGCPMLFAATDEAGRIRLLRTPPVLRFEDRRTTIRPPPMADEDKTPAVPAPVSTKPLPLVRPPQQSFAGALALPPPPALPRMTPLPPPPRARIAARLPPPPPFPSARPRQQTEPDAEPPVLEQRRSPSGIRPAPNAPKPISVPVRVRAGNMSIKRLVRGK
jgi:hypothetical protein